MSTFHDAVERQTLSTDQQPPRSYVRPTTPNESRRLTDIGGKSGHHAVIVGQTRGAGYLGDMQGFALPFALLMIAVFVSVMRIWIGADFPIALVVIGGISAFATLGFGIFLSYLFVRNAAEVDYIDANTVKRISTYLHIAEAMLVIVWFNWLTSLIPITGAISGPVFTALAIAVITLRVIRRRQTRRRHLWER